VIITDLPGFGATERRFDDNFSHTKYAERIYLLVKALGLKTVHIGGNSMGGRIAGVFAAKYPEITETLWMLDPAGTKAGAQSEIIKAALTGRNILIPSTVDDYKELISANFFVKPPIPEFVVRSLANENIKNKPMLSVVWKFLVGHDNLAEELSTSAYKKPILIVWGENDRILDVKGAYELKDALPWAELEVMKATGHLPVLERTEETAHSYLKFRKLI
jgi:triacylglycerol lipase